MALEFNLRLQTSFSPNEIVELIVQQKDFEKSEKDGDFYAKGLVGWVYSMDEISQQITFEETGIKANLNIRCWHDYDEYKDGMRNILKIFIVILNNTNGDAVLEHDSGFINLLRKNNKITLNSNSFSHNGEALWRFQDIPFEYEIKEINLNE